MSKHRISSYFTALSTNQNKHFRKTSSSKISAENLQIEQ